MDSRRFLGSNREFIESLATMISGKALAAVIPLFTAPIVSRLFEPTDFGIAAVFMSIVGILSTVSALRYDGAIVLPADSKEAIDLMAFSYRLTIAFCLAMYVVIASMDMTGLATGEADVLGVWKWFLPVGVLVQAAVQIQESWLVRIKAFRQATISLVTGTALSSVARIAFGLISGTSTYGLIFGNLSGMVSRVLMQQRLCRDALRALFSRADWQEMRTLAKQYSDFPRLNAPGQIIFALGQNLPVLLFGVLFSPATAGLYAMANRLVRAPVTVVAGSMRAVFMQKSAEIKNRGRSLNRAFLKATGGLALLGLFPVLVMWMYGQPILGWVLGARWVEAGRYLEIIAPWVFMIWVASPCNPVYVVLRKQSLWLGLQIMLTVLRLSVFGMAFYMALSVETTLRFFVLVSSLGNLAMIFMASILIIRHGNEVKAGGS